MTAESDKGILEAIVKAAVGSKDRKTSTGEPHRGWGIADMVSAVNKSRQGRLAIYSGQGFVKYCKNAENQKGAPQAGKLIHRLAGTVVEYTEQIGDNHN